MADILARQVVFSPRDHFVFHVARRHFIHTKEFSFFMLQKHRQGIPTVCRRSSNVFCMFAQNGAAGKSLF